MSNTEPWAWPNRPGYSFVKAMEWEQPLWPATLPTLVLPDWSCVELKRLDADEFSHWSHTDFGQSARTRRKRREWEVFNSLAHGAEAPDGRHLRRGAGGHPCHRARPLHRPPRDGGQTGRLRRAAHPPVDRLRPWTTRPWHTPQRWWGPSEPAGSCSRANDCFSSEGSRPLVAAEAGLAYALVPDAPSLLTASGGAARRARPRGALRARARRGVRPLPGCRAGGAPRRRAVPPLGRAREPGGLPAAPPLRRARGGGRGARLPGRQGRRAPGRPVPDRRAHRGARRALGDLAALGEGPARRDDRARLLLLPVRGAARDPGTHATAGLDAGARSRPRL